MNKENIKPSKPKVVFGVKLGGKERFFRFKVNQLNLSPYGVISTEDAIKESNLIKSLIEDKSFVLEEVDEQAYQEYEDAKPTEEETLSSEERIAQLEKLIAELTAGKGSKEVTSSVKVDPPKGTDTPDAEFDALKQSYEELTGNKPGNKKSETLQKEMEEFKSKKEK